MVVIPIVWASLRPLPFVISTAKFLPDHGISHIEEAEDQTPQVGQVGNATPCPRPGSVKLEKTEDDHHVFGRDGEEEID